MADIWEITTYLDEHPEDHEQRWHLAKKLYQDENYRIALEHLQVLHREWNPYVNVERYLAATYYRLGRYDEAIAVLDAAVDAWPNETGVREQLGRVLEVAGRRQDARRVWEKIKEIVPDHPLAAQSIERLSEEAVEKQQAGQSQSQGPATPVLGLKDSVLMTRPARVCPRCGTQNIDEAKRCIECGMPFTANISTPVPEPKSTTPVPEPPREHIEVSPGFAKWVNFTTVTGLLTAIVFVIGAYTTFQHMALAERYRQGEDVIRNAYGLLQVVLLPSHMAMGGAMLATWPLFWLLALRLVGAPAGYWKKALLAGAFLATLTYALSWSSTTFIGYVPLVPIVASLLFAALAFELHIVQAIFAWLIQGILAVCVTVLAFIGVEGIQPVDEADKIIEYVAAQETAKEPGTWRLPPMRAPASCLLEWESTGSTWLDRHAKHVELFFETSGRPQPIVVVLKGSEGTIAREEFADGSGRLRVTVSPHRIYQLAVTGSRNTPVAVTVLGTLPVKPKA